MMKNHHLMKRYTTTFIQVIQTEVYPVQTGIIMHIFILHQIPDSIIIPITIVIGGSLPEIENQSGVVTNVAGYNYIGEYQGHHYFSKESSSYYWYQAANTINDFSQYGKDAYMYIPNSGREHNFVKAQLTSNYYWLGLLKDSYDDPQRTYVTGWRDVKGNYMSSSESRDYLSTVSAGSSIKFTYDYTITTEDVNAEYPTVLPLPQGLKSVTDISDDGDDSDGNTEDDPTETTMFTIMSMEATKTVSPTDVMEMV